MELGLVDVAQDSHDDSNQKLTIEFDVPKKNMHIDFAK